MPTHYQSIRTENARRYGTDIGRIGQMLLADRYDDRTHFIFELLQNAEDALARRRNWPGQRSVRFLLGTDQLTFSHFGEPFDGDDVGGVCGIAESTKRLTAIGRFGIGFKSVYAFTDRPEIHSGDEAFAIERFVHPVAVEALQRSEDETVIAIPFREESDADRMEITAGLRRLGARALLFLREIQELEWEVEDGPSGLYLRDSPQILGEGIRRVTVVGQEEGGGEVEETWTVFSRPVTTEQGQPVGNVELAFQLAKDEADSDWTVRRVATSPLVVYFPTVLETHLGFLAQGPYRTTPSRDNVPKNDDWNRHCVEETAELLVHALRWLRDQGGLGTGALQCLPLTREKFGPRSMLEPLFERTRQAFLNEPLLPCYGGGHAPAEGACLARSGDLRELFNPDQLGDLLSEGQGLKWLSGDISQDRTPELRDYLMRELDIVEITPERILLHLNRTFLEAQADEWIVKLYEFLNERPALHSKLSRLPLVRLADGIHVRAWESGQPQAFLPGDLQSDFPTVRKAVCTTNAALEFLRTLDLAEPNAVDDVVQNVLPKYASHEVGLSEDEYQADLRRIIDAFATDSTVKREKLREILSQTRFVMAVLAGNGERKLAKPDEVYLSTDRLKELFVGVSNVALVDDQVPTLHGQAARELLEGCGAVRYLRPIPDRSLSQEELRELRERSGYEKTSGQNDRIKDWTLHGLGELIAALSNMKPEERRHRANLLWEELSNLEDRRGKGVFTGEYTWTHYGNHRAPPFDSAFVRTLNSAEWVPDEEGVLRRPDSVLFESLKWRENPFLLSKVRFKPPAIEELAREAGIESGVLELLKKHGMTSVEQLLRRLRFEEEPPRETPESEQGAGEDAGSSDATGGERRSGSGNGGTRRSQGDDATQGSGGPGRVRTSGPEGLRSFISYLGVHPKEEAPDPDGLAQEERMALEEKAIGLIRAQEPDWERTPPGNHGYDLFKRGSHGLPEVYCEVKAMTQSLGHRPVGLSRTQFDAAQQAGDAYWLYVVEHTGDEGRSRIVRIRDPARKAKTFTFDGGWVEVAKLDDSAGGPPRLAQGRSTRPPPSAS